MKSAPLEIRRLGPSGIEITWDNGHKQQLNSNILRNNCPCATCKEARGEGSHSAPLTPQKKSALKIVESSLSEQTNLLEIWPVGNYALGMMWGDKHSSGIYTFEYLASLNTR